jgi:glutathione S-transferase
LAPAAGTREYLRLVEWLVFIATELHKPAGSLFNPAYGDESKAVTTGLLRRRLDYADTTLGHVPYLMGNVCGIADFYLFTVLSWLPRLGFNLGDWPHLAAHLARTGALPAVQTAMKAEMLL